MDQHLTLMSVMLHFMFHLCRPMLTFCDCGDTHTSVYFLTVGLRYVTIKLILKYNKPLNVCIQYIILLTVPQN